MLSCQFSRLFWFLSLSIYLCLSGCSDYRKPSQSIEVAVKGAQAAALADNGELAIIGSIHHGGSLWRIADAERLFNWNHKAGDTTTILSADFSSDGRWAATADTYALALWDTRTGEAERFWTAPGEILDLELGPQAQTALLGLDDHSAVLFDIQRGGIRQTLGHLNRVRSVDISRDGRRALTGSEDYLARVWDLESGKVVARMEHNDDVQLVRLSYSGELALSVSKYDKALIWQTASGELVAELPLAAEYLKRGMRFTAARFSENDELLLTGRSDQVVELWQIDVTGQVGTISRIERWRLPKRSAWKPTAASVLAVSFSNEEGVYYAVAANGFIHRLEGSEPK